MAEEVLSNLFEHFASILHNHPYYSGYWTTRGYANSRIANSRTGRLADWTSRGLVNLRTRQLAYWTSRGRPPVKMRIWGFSNV